MQRQMLKSKIHRARVTSTNIDYEGSLAIDRKLMEKADILPFEKISIYNITNGSRFETYAISGEPGEIMVNGAAARLADEGDIIIIAAYALVDEVRTAAFTPKIIKVDQDNRPAT
ncbi:MAG: aspartate 1-decarboxylase [bacterium]